MCNGTMVKTMDECGRGFAMQNGVTEISEGEDEVDQPITH